MFCLTKRDFFRESNSLTNLSALHYKIFWPKKILPLFILIVSINCTSSRHYQSLPCGVQRLFCLFLPTDLQISLRLLQRRLSDCIVPCQLQYLYTFSNLTHDAVCKRKHIFTSRIENLYKQYNLACENTSQVHFIVLF